MGFAWGEAGHVLVEFPDLVLCQVVPEVCEGFTKQRRCLDECLVDSWLI